MPEPVEGKARRFNKLSDRSAKSQKPKALVLSSKFRVQKKLLDICFLTLYLCKRILNHKVMKTSDFTIMPRDGICKNEIRSLIMKEEYIEKQEILDAIREGLLEIKERRESGIELMDAEDLLNEL